MLTLDAVQIHACMHAGRMEFVLPDLQRTSTHRWAKCNDNDENAPTLNKHPKVLPA